MLFILLAVGLSFIALGIVLSEKARMRWDKRSISASGTVTKFQPVPRGEDVAYLVTARLSHLDCEIQIAKLYDLRPALGMVLPVRYSCSNENLVLPEGLSDVSFAPTAFIVIGCIITTVATVSLG